jgi:hypothetical protein
MNKKEILDIVHIIQKSNIQNKEEHFFEIYSDFAEKYPHLYKYVCNNSKIQYDMLEFMLDKIFDIDSNITTQNKASEEVGTKLFDEYVKPVIPLMQKKS